MLISFRHSFLFILVCLLFIKKADAQRFNFSFEQFTTDDGLSHENVINITKDKDGFPLCIFSGPGNCKYIFSKRGKQRRVDSAI